MFEFTSEARISDYIRKKITFTMSAPGKEPMDQDRVNLLGVEGLEDLFKGNGQIVDVVIPRPPTRKPVTGLDEKKYQPQNRSFYTIFGEANDIERSMETKKPDNDVQRKGTFELYLFSWFQTFLLFMKKEWQPFDPDQHGKIQQKRKYKVLNNIEPTSRTTQIVGGQAFEVAPVDGMGRGLVAKQDLNVGDIIQFTADVLLMLPPNWDMVKMNEETGKIEMSDKTVPLQHELGAKSSKMDRMTYEALNGALTTLVAKNFERKKDKAKFNNLEGADTYEKLRLNNFYATTLCWRDETDPKSEKICSIDVTILFDLISMMNHDNDPNTKMLYPDINPLDRTPMLNLNFQNLVWFKVIKPIKKGDQVTQDYKPDSVGAEKLHELQSIWGIGAARRPETRAGGAASSNASASAKRKKDHTAVMERQASYYDPFMNPEKEAGAPSFSFWDDKYGNPEPNARKTRNKGSMYSLNIPAAVRTNYQVDPVDMTQGDEKDAVAGLLALEKSLWTDQEVVSSEIDEQAGVAGLHQLQKPQD